jgi:3-hydroxy acid dehydrogenase/malonic semialdehyde reductase
MKTVFITGSTSGLGRELVYRFAREGYRLFLQGRDKQTLVLLQNELMDNYQSESYILVSDIKDLVLLESEIRKIPDEWREVDVLINNAGVAYIRPFEHLTLSNIVDTIDVNLKGVICITHLLLPFLKKTKGHIINIGSIGSQEPFENGNVYSSSKKAIDQFSKCLRTDLLMDEVRVSVVHPGYIDNQFATKSMSLSKTKESFFRGFVPLQMKEVSDIIYFLVAQSRSLCIDEVIVTPTQQAGPKTIYRKNSI